MSSAFNGGALGSQASQELAGDLSLFKVSKQFWLAQHFPFTTLQLTDC
jgi:hypothetical protein